MDSILILCTHWNYPLRSDCWISLEVSLWHSCLLCSVQKTLVKLFVECNVTGNTNWIAKVHFCELIVQKVWIFRSHQNCTIYLAPEAPLYPSSQLSVLCSFEGWAGSHIWIHVSFSVTFVLMAVFSAPCISLSFSLWLWILHLEFQCARAKHPVVKHSWEFCGLVSSQGQ